MTLKLRKACSNRGADHGRPSFLPENPETPLTLKVYELTLEDGGYDRWGSYWGERPRGVRLFWAESLEKMKLERYAYPQVGTVEMTCDATSWERAVKHFQSLCPGAVLCPSKWKQVMDKRTLLYLYNKGRILPSQAGRVWGKDWPFVRAGYGDTPEHEFEVSRGGYVRRYRVHKISDVGDPTFVVEEKVYDYATQQN